VEHQQIVWESLRVLTATKVVASLHQSMANVTSILIAQVPKYVISDQGRRLRENAEHAISHHNVHHKEKYVTMRNVLMSHQSHHNPVILIPIAMEMRQDVLSVTNHQMQAIWAGYAPNAQLINSAPRLQGPRVRDIVRPMLMRYRNASGVSMMLIATRRRLPVMGCVSDLERRTLIVLSNVPQMQIVMLQHGRFAAFMNRQNPH
jgi:hypothetical protein